MNIINKKKNTYPMRNCETVSNNNKYENKFRTF